MLFYDGFSDTAGAPLLGQSGATGGSGSWFENTAQGSSPSVIASGSLTFGHLATRGNSMQFRSDLPVGDGYNLATTMGSPGDVVYISVLVRPLDPLNVGSPDTYFGFGFNNLFIGKPGASGAWGIGHGGPDPGFVGSGVLAQQNQTAFLVLRITFASGADTLELWVNPTPGQPLPATPDAVRRDLDVGTMSQITCGGSIRCQFDEFRVGTTWPVVSPTSP